MNICILGYPRIDDIICSGVAKVTQRFTLFFERCGDKVYNYHFFTLQEYDELYNFCLMNKIDVAIWHMSSLNLGGKINLPCPLISVWHSAINYEVDNDKLKRFHVSKVKFINKIVDAHLKFIHKIRNQLIFSYVTYKSEYLVLLSDRFKSDLLASLIFPNKILSIPNCQEPNNMNFTEEDKKKSVLFVGRLVPLKGVDMLLKAWSIVEKCHNDWELLIVGDGPCASELRSLSNKLLLKNVKWIGWTANPGEYYKSSKIFCLTSRYEGWGLTLTEALSFGCVPIAFNSYRSLPDIVTDNFNGLVIPPFDITLYAQKLMDLMNDELKLKMMSDNALASIKKFDPNSIMNRWWQLVQNVVSKSKKAR